MTTHLRLALSAAQRTWSADPPRLCSTCEGLGAIAAACSSYPWSINSGSPLVQPHLVRHPGSADCGALRRAVRTRRRYCAEAAKLATHQRASRAWLLRRLLTQPACTTSPARFAWQGFFLRVVVRGAGLEPAQSFNRKDLNLVRLPFRHPRRLPQSAPLSANLPPACCVCRFIGIRVAFGMADAQFP